MSDYIDYTNPKFTPPASKERPTVIYPYQAEYPLAPFGDQAMQALEIVKETTTPVARAIGLGLRLLPFTICWLVLAIVLALALHGALVVPFLLFAGLTAATYYAMNRQEYEYSAAGLERHKANLAANLRATQLKNDHELKRAALRSYIKHLEASDR